MDRHDSNQRQRDTFTRAIDWFAGPQDPTVEPRLRQIAAAAHIEPHHDVLDVGTGTGALLPFLLAHEPASLTGVDLAAAMLAHARQRYGDRVELIEGDLCELEGEDRFDRIVCNAMWWNLPDQTLALERCAGLLRPGGRLVISHPMGAEFVWTLREQDPATVYDDPVDDTALQDRVRGAGFSIAERRHEPELYLLVAVQPG